MCSDSYKRVINNYVTIIPIIENSIRKKKKMFTKYYFIKIENSAYREVV